MTPRPILAAVIFAALTPAVALGTVGVLFVAYCAEVSRSKAATNARESLRHRRLWVCEDAHFDDETCPRCCPEVDDLTALADALGVLQRGAIDRMDAYVLGLLIDRAVEGETCPDYPDEIVWGQS